ncbi:MAG TPA: PAS domain S-box protein [Balneolaceae bacterium]|nr:PAS domain S-box protein [Balneolaceae bacterium]
MDNLEQKLESLAKDEKSLKELKELFSDVSDERDKFKKHLMLLERAIKSDYDSILITELGLEEPGPKIVYVNDGFTKMTGYTHEEVLGKTPRILQGEKTDRAVLDKLKERLKEGKAFFGHTVNYRKDGSEFINQWDIHPLTNDKGEITHWVSYQHDITERKRSEKKVVDSEMEFDKLREESKKTLIDVDEQGNIVTSNKAFRDLTGYTDDELKKFKFWEILEDELIETYKHKFDSFKPSDFNDRAYEMVIKNKKGGPVEVKASARILTVHGQQIVRMSFENRSLQKRIMAILSKRNADFERVFERDKDFNYKLIKTAGDEYMFEYVSDSFSKITGITADEAVTLSITDIIHEDDLDTFFDHLDIVMDGKPNTEQYRIKSKDGGYIEVIDYAKPEWNADRTAVAAIKGATSTEISSEYNSN